MKEYTVKVFNNRTEWYKIGTEIPHRLDGPAIEYADGSGSKYWFIEGKQCSEKDK